MKLDVFNTHMELSPYNEETRIHMLEDLYIIEDKFTLKPMVCGFLVDNGVMYLPKGTPINMIENVKDIKANRNHKSDTSSRMSRIHYTDLDLRDDLQKQSVEFLTKESNAQLGLNLSMGLGKAIPINAKLPTPNGDRLMRDIRIGDQVFGSNGKPVIVTGTFDNGIVDTYKITFGDGRYSLCTIDHQWAVFEYNKLITTNTREMIDNFNSKIYKIPRLTNPVEYFINGEIQIIEDFDINEKMILVPERFKYYSINLRKFILKRIIELNGRINDDNTMSITSKYPLLLEGIKHLAYGLGYYLSSTTKDSLFINPNTNTNYLQVVSIEKYGRDHCKCISVDAEDKLYLTEDFIVTHNTFVSCYAATKLNEKFIVITHSEGIKNQWIKTLHEMFDYESKDLINISGNNVIEAIMNDEIKPGDVYFANHATLRNYLTLHNGYMLHQFFKKLKVGIKIYDESHLEFANILLLDFFSNTKRNWYLTATFDRSDKEESRCFKQAFSSVIQFGEYESKEATEKHVIYHVVNINSKATPRDKGRICGFRGMTGASYGHYAFQYDEKDTAFKAITIILDKIKDLEGKIIIYTPLIESCDNVAKKLKDLYPDKKIGAYHSQVSSDEKESVLKKDIIVSTIKSMGVGRDLKGLRSIICAEPIASKVVATQLLGRLRPYAKDKETYFFDIVDISIPPINWWFKSRMKAIQQLAKKIVYLNISE